MKSLFFTVTNDLSFDQRMIRICGSLTAAGYDVTLVGRKKKSSQTLDKHSFRQKRLSCFFEKGKWFYIEYNIRLFFWLLFQKMDIICAIDLDTILPCYGISKIKRIPRVYDAHELFCEMKEVVTRPAVHRIWKAIEKFTVPKFKFGYTVSNPIAEIFHKDYGVRYPVIRNISKLKPRTGLNKKERIILYQGAVNEGRCFESLIPAMQWVDAPLHIYGDGNYIDQAKALITLYSLEKKVLLKGKVSPDLLTGITETAMIGITLFENTGLSNYFSLSNRFFDYIQAGIPQICSNYPCYQALNDQYSVAKMIVTQTPANIARELNNLLDNEVLYSELVQNCKTAASQLNWENEELILTSFYKKML